MREKGYDFQGVAAEAHREEHAPSHLALPRVLKVTDKMPL